MISSRGIPKSMAIGIYGQDLREIHPYIGRLKDLAFEVHINESPANANAVSHQGINLNLELTRR